MPNGDAYSEIADQQLDDIQAKDSALYDAVLTACELIFDQPRVAQANSAAITTRDGIRFVLPVAGQHPYKVFWLFGY